MTSVNPPFHGDSQHYRHTFGLMTFMRVYLLLAFLLPLLVKAQEDAPPVKLFEKHQGQRADTPTTALQKVQEPGDIAIHADPRIDRLMQLHGEHKHTFKGYRVQIYLGDRRTAEDTKRSFLQKHPELPIYMSWLAPNFRLRVGDIRTRLEAQRLLRDLRAEYPGSYIVPDEIEMPRIAAPQ